jgi:hypothetical protein
MGKVKVEIPVNKSVLIFIPVNEINALFLNI